MNRILFAARMAKGLTEKQLAEKLEMNETAYKEIEMGISSMTLEMAEIFENIFHVPFHYFLVPVTDNVKTAIYALEKTKEILNEIPDIHNVSDLVQAQLSIAKMGLHALVAEERQGLLLLQIRELEVENELFKNLFRSKFEKPGIDYQCQGDDKNQLITP